MKKEIKKIIILIGLGTPATIIWRKIKNIWLKTRNILLPGAVILLYHRVALVKDDPHLLSVSPKFFKAQLEGLLEERYIFMKMSECVNLIKTKTLKNKVIVITFDDGYLDNLEIALPILKSLNIPATVFVTAGKIDDPEPFYWDQKTNFKDRGRSMNQEELRKLSIEPLIEIGSHTMTHPHLSQLSSENQLKEIENSKKTVENIIKKNIHGFAYPFGGKDTDFTKETENLVKKSGFLYACATTKDRYTRFSNTFSIPRLTIRNWSADRVIHLLRNF